MENKDFNIEKYVPTSDSIQEGYTNPEFEKGWDSTSEQLDKNLAIAFLGTASSGKTSGIKALFQIDLGDIHPIPGSTTKVKVRNISENVFLVDAPGFGDIRKEIYQKAKDICDKIDIFIYVLNAEGGYKMQEKEDYENLLIYNREVLVVLNKIDLIREHQREEFIEDQREKMGVSPTNFIPVAFDPLPQISTQPINLDTVRNWIQETLEKKGKDLLFAKVARGKDKICDRWIAAACVSAAAIGALPIPGSDYLPLTSLQAGLIAKIAHTYGHSPDKKDIIALIGQTLAGQIGKQVFRAIITLAKGAGWIPGAGWILQVFTSAVASSIAASVTYGLGEASKVYYKSGMTIPTIEVQEIFKKSYELKRKE